MNLWQQNYDPAGNIWLSSLIASLPILFFFFALIKLKLKGYVAASWTVVIALTVALLFYKMPVDHALASVVYGFFYGLWPIADHYRRCVCLQNLGKNRAVRHHPFIHSVDYP